MSRSLRKAYNLSPKISIIVPIYNVEPYLHCCIDSILAQSFTDFELILVDDGSTDQCGSICESYKGKDDRVRVIHQNNQGVSAARNRGIEASKGDFIGFVDPDDKIAREMFQQLYSAVSHTTIDMVICPILTINVVKQTRTTSQLWREVNRPLLNETITSDIIPSMLRQHRSYSIYSCNNKLYRRALIRNKNIWFEEGRQHSEDVRFNFRLLPFARSIIFIDSTAYLYFVRPRASLTQSFRTDLFDYIADNRRFNESLCKRYGDIQALKTVRHVFILTSLNFMQDVVRSDLALEKIRAILSTIMEDEEFKKNIADCTVPSPYYKLLKWLCMNKRIELFIKVVKAKATLYSVMGKAG
ncbi:hypothetical protein GCM10011391_06510 [Pullulanibacillus camelliae]|uniref:Glycosyltransferase 2-like domain-containing protein n=1 Tax=Pullulanibacillus camelliae TaxID=1707096 RepID=A0A8J2VL36_9BACL|nr:glycosyltransferase [Pullulanibacillus camelliae]GGE30547.1 hypothetical protein GCM10011391_06510 [Pullulanibacillus camelliae]